MVRTGSHGYIQYAWESTFATDAGSSAYTKPFGLRHYHFKPCNTFVDFILSNPWLFKSVYGTASTSGLSAPYTHTFPHASNGQPKTVTTFSTEVGFAGETENISRKLLGCILTSFSISTAVDDLVNCSADITFGNEGDATTSLDATPAADDINFPYTFAHGALKWYNGSSLTTVAPTEHSVSGLEPVEPVFETINWEARGATVVAINGESTAK